MRRRGFVEASLLILLAALLLAGVFVTVGRSTGAVRQVDRLERRAELAAALESRLAECWWELRRAIPARSRRVPGVRATSGGTAFRSRVLGALCEQTGGAAPEAMPAGATLSIVSSEDGGRTGLLALRAQGRAGTVSLSIEHRRRYRVTATKLGNDTMGTVHVLPPLESVAVNE